MIICESCAKGYWVGFKSFGPCEVCDVITECFDIPAEIVAGRPVESDLSVKPVGDE